MALFTDGILNRAIGLDDIFKCPFLCLFQPFWTMWFVQNKQSETNRDWMPGWDRPGNFYCFLSFTHSVGFGWVLSRLKSSHNDPWCTVWKVVTQRTAQQVSDTFFVQWEQNERKWGEPHTRDAFFLFSTLDHINKLVLNSHTCNKSCCSCCYQLPKDNMKSSFQYSLRSR